MQMARESERRSTGSPSLYALMSQGGFDVVIGNPPYVTERILDYESRRLPGRTVRPTSTRTSSKER